MPQKNVSITAQDSAGKLVQATVTVLEGDPNIKVTTSKESYKSGDTIELKLGIFSAEGWDVYVALVIPPSLDFWFFKGKADISADMHKFIKNSSGSWQELLKFPLGNKVGIPLGKYTLYGAMVPEGEDLFKAIESGNYLLDFVSFDVME